MKTLKKRVAVAFMAGFIYSLNQDKYGRLYNNLSIVFGGRVVYMIVRSDLGWVQTKGKKLKPVEDGGITFVGKYAFSRTSKLPRN